MKTPRAKDCHKGFMVEWHVATHGGCHEVIVVIVVVTIIVFTIVVVVGVTAVGDVITFMFLHSASVVAELRRGH